MDWSITSKTETNTFTKTDQEEEDQYSAALASLARAAGAADENEDPEATLKRIYDRIDKLDAGERRRHLLAIERKRPKIYRRARTDAIEQITAQDPGVLQGEQSATIIDLLGYKYLAVHYAPNWPLWFTRPLGMAPT